MAPRTHSTTRHYFVSPQEIGFLRFILEGYEGIAIVSTLLPSSGLVQLSIAPGCEREVEQILTAEKEALQLRPVVLSESIGAEPDETGG